MKFYLRILGIQKLYRFKLNKNAKSLIDISSLEPCQLKVCWNWIALKKSDYEIVAVGGETGVSERVDSESCVTNKDAKRPHCATLGPALNFVAYFRLSQHVSWNKKKGEKTKRGKSPLTARGCTVLILYICRIVRQFFFLPLVFQKGEHTLRKER